MIYTVTLNPAVDYHISLEELNGGKVNRSSNEQIFFGGKGINVSYMLKNLGVDSIATGIIGGFTGKALTNHLKLLGIKSDFTEVSGFTRINVKIHSGTAEETEINGSGPFVDEQTLNDLIKKLKALKNDTLVLSGSLPASLKPDTYKRIIEVVKPNGVKVLVDTSGDALFSAISAGPFLIKPNIHELSELVHKKLKTVDEVIEAAKSIQKFGVGNILVSMGEKGAVLVAQSGEVIYMEAPHGNAVNTVGSGDSMLAGFIAGLVATKGNIKNALKMAVAAGSATAFSEGIATKSEVMEIFSDKMSSL